MSEGEPESEEELSDEVDPEREAELKIQKKLLDFIGAELSSEEFEEEPFE